MLLSSICSWIASLLLLASPLVRSFPHRIASPHRLQSPHLLASPRPHPFVNRIAFQPPTHPPNLLAFPHQLQAPHHLAFAPSSSAHSAASLYAPQVQLTAASTPPVHLFSPLQLVSRRCLAFPFARCLMLHVPSVWTPRGLSRPPRLRPDGRERPWGCCPVPSAAMSLGLKRLPAGLLWASKGPDERQKRR